MFGVMALFGGGICGAGRISLPPGVVGPLFGSSSCLIKLDSVEVGCGGGAIGGAGDNGGLLTDRAWLMFWFDWRLLGESALGDEEGGCPVAI